jgi:pullulanase-type alpha-1,6-glucosidase
MAGTGIGTFNDRIRDAIRGGGPFDGGLDLIGNQGFINGLFYDPNTLNSGSSAERDELLLSADQIRVGLAGNLKDYEFEDRNGNVVKGEEVDYNGAPTGYTLDPQEHIAYSAAHDNQTQFDIIQYKAPLDTAMEDRVRMQNLGISLVALSQGVPFFHAGIDMLRSKSFDQDSYNSGDWFNALDFTYESNNWGKGLPVAEKNQANWPIMQPLLADPDLAATGTDIRTSVEHLREMLRIRKSTPLFRLQSADEVKQKVKFLNTGSGQMEGLIVMGIVDDDEDGGVDPAIKRIVVLFNATPETITFEASELADYRFDLDQRQRYSKDKVVRQSRFDRATGSFTVPARTTAVFVARQVHNRNR